MNNVVEFALKGRRPRRPAGDLDAVIHQEDLEELILLGRRAHESVQAWKKKNDALLWMALNGWPIEPGVHTARAVTVSRKAHQVNGSQFYRLVVR